MIDNCKFEMDAGWWKYKEGIFLPRSFPREAVYALKDFKLRDGDILCDAHPKTGGYHFLFIRCVLRVWSFKVVRV